MQKTLENLSSVTLYFLVVLGGLHLSSAFLLADQVKSTTLLLLFNNLDLPFLTIALLYGSTRLSLSMEKIAEAGKTTFITCMAASSLVLLLALYLNFTFSDARLF